METIVITSIIIGGTFLCGFVMYLKNAKTSPLDRPNINIDFDTAKEREDKNRYFS